MRQRNTNGPGDKKGKRGSAKTGTGTGNYVAGKNGGMVEVTKATQKDAKNYQKLQKKNEKKGDTFF